VQENKLKIDLTLGIIEVEGSEQLVRDIYNDFKERLNQAPSKVSVLEKSSPQTETPPAEPATKATKKASAGKPKSKPKSSASNSGTLLKDLDLTSSGEKDSLRDFYNKYEATSNLERNLVFVYYLQNIREMEGVTINHIFTCYRNIPELKAPGHLKQSVVDAAYKKGWLDTSDMENITVPISGINYLEHDLPKKSTEAS
tara:strand:- start:2824 stop:3420 length:597 start_codon:yes stop_codon:yes gene_type:complete